MSVNINELLADNMVKEEIARYQWIESEKAGYTIEEHLAAKEWVERHALAWIRHHRPSQHSPARRVRQQMLSARQSPYCSAEEN